MIKFMIWILTGNLRIFLTKDQLYPFMILNRIGRLSKRAASFFVGQRLVSSVCFDKELLFMATRSLSFTGACFAPPELQV
jgi:hypothetical protein